MDTGGAGQRKARLLVVDSHAIVRHGIAQLAREQADMVVAHETDNTEDALAVLQREEVDLAIVELALSGISGLELLAQIKAQHPKVSVLVFTGLDEKLYLERAMRAGASGYVMKQESLDALLQAIRKALRGGVYMSEAMQNVVLQRYLGKARGRGTNSVVDALSRREFEVFQLIGQGFGTSEIASKLHRSVKTIEAHRATLKEKLGLKSGIELTQFAANWLRQRE